MKIARAAEPVASGENDRARHRKAAVAALGGRHRRVVRHQRPARARAADHERPPVRRADLPGEPQRLRGARFASLPLGGRAAGARRSRGADHPGEIRAAGARALRQGRHPGGDHPELGLRRGGGWGGPRPAGRGPRHCRPPRHGGDRPQRGRLRQHGGGPVPDLLAGDGSGRDAARSAGRARARPGGGDLAKRRHGLFLVRPRPAERPLVPLRGDHRQRSLPRGVRSRRLHAGGGQDRRLPVAARGREEPRDLRARGGQGRCAPASR